MDDDEWSAAQTAELEALHDKINRGALIQRVKELSGGLNCRLDKSDPLGLAKMGGMHLHLAIHLEDGTIWLARIPRQNYTSFSDDLTNDILLSEYATLKWLQDVDIPTPKAHGYGLQNSPDNQVGVAYMLIDQLPGRPFDSVMATQEQKGKVLEQWAKQLAVLSQKSFPTIGCLTLDGEGTIQVGPIVGDRTGTLPSIGPFKSAVRYYGAWADAYLDLIADRQLFSEYSVDAYLMFKELQECTTQAAWLDKWGDVDAGPFFLKHMDEKGDHILVDKNFEITGIIDWTFARTVPAYEAFGPSLVSANNNHLFSGKPGLSDDDVRVGRAMQRQGGPSSYAQSDEIRRYLFGLGIGLGLTKEEVWDVFRAIIITLKGSDSIAIDLQQWRQAMLSKWASDSRLIALLNRKSSSTES